MRLRFDTLPVDEIAAYTEIMDRITKSKDENSKKIILRVLSWTRGSQRFLSIRELREVIWVEEMDAQLRTKEIDGLRLENIIRNCESLVTCDDTGLVRFSHDTVYEFLEKNDFAHMTHVALAKICITYLNFQVFGAPYIDVNESNSIYVLPLCCAVLGGSRQKCKLEDERCGFG
jgi:hypothetical protein